MANDDTDMLDESLLLGVDDWLNPDEARERNRTVVEEIRDLRRQGIYSADALREVLCAYANQMPAVTWGLVEERVKLLYSEEIPALVGLWRAVTSRPAVA